MKTRKHELYNMQIPDDLARRFHVIGADLARVDYYRQGNFTLAILSGPRGPVSFGIAKRNVGDTERPQEARRMALARALRRVKEEVE